jgi:SAM-dependent methyltransferase
MTATARKTTVTQGDPRVGAGARRLSARLEPFDSYWQAPEDVERGYRSFHQYYRCNFLGHVPADRTARILVVSCGPGYLVNLLAGLGYTAVLGIDSDPVKIAHATRRGLNCQVAPAFEYLEGRAAEFDTIICEQELNHLTFEEMIAFLRLCWTSLTPDGTLIVYGLNGANPIVGAENLTHNIDHFNAFTEHSLRQVLDIAGFTRIRPFPLRLYVFWTNPLNYVGLVATGVLSLCFRACFALYGKKVTILTKKIGAVCHKGA